MDSARTDVHILRIHPLLLSTPDRIISSLDQPTSAAINLVYDDKGVSALLQI
jgi:hypothetical protein